MNNTPTSIPQTKTAKELAAVYGDCPATNNGRHHVKAGQIGCSKCGAQ